MTFAEALPVPDFVTIARIEVSQSADFRDHATLVDPDTAGPYTIMVGGKVVSCAPRDITGKHLEFVIAPSYDFSQQIDSLSDSAGITIDADSTTGGFTFDVAQDRVAGWPVGSWVFVMRERTIADGSLKDVMRGSFLVFPRPF